MRLPDPLTSSIAVLGTSTYVSGGGLADVPAVANNVQALQSLFRDPDLCGLPDSHVSTLLDPDTPAQVDVWLTETAKSARDLLLVYYSGHGVIGEDEELYLTVGESNLERIHSTGVPFAWVKRAMLDSPAQSRILILDCCHSGQALVRLGRLGGVPAALNQIDIEGTHVLTASGPSQAARAPLAAEYTAFTDVLLQLLRNGVNGGPEFLTLGYLYPYLRELLIRAGLPKPHQQSKDTASQLALVRNAAFVHGAAPALQVPGDPETITAGEIVPRSDYVPARESLRELRRRAPKYAPRHYDRLAAAYYDEGYDGDAEQVMIDKTRARYAAKASARPLAAPIVLTWSWFQRWSTGYGYRPSRMMVWLFMFTVLGSVWFTVNGPSKGTIQATGPWNPVLYTLDQILPIINLGQKDRWYFSGPSMWVSNILALAGWVMTLTLIACAARALRR